LRVVIEPDAETAARRAAERIAALVRLRPAGVLALAAGSTMVPVYRALAASQAREGRSFAGVTGFQLDEYAGIGADDPRSFRRFLREQLWQRIDARPDHLFAPDGLAADLAAECARYEAAIAAAGGLDLALLGLGRNGHLAFNEPGASLAGATHVEVLMRESRLAPDLPRLALTMGLGTICAARACLVVASGAAKAAPAAAMIEGPVAASCPASALQLHPDATALLDAAAASRLRHADHYREAEALRRESEAVGLTAGGRRRRER
jgi:glucosamine-6-phosphate deaminase